MIIVLSARPNIDPSILAARLAADANVPVVADPTRDLCAAYGYQTLYEIPVDMQITLRRRLIEEHFTLISSGASMVCSFSVFPWLADWMRWLWRSTPCEMWDEIIDDARKSIARYTQIHHLVNGPIRPYDGFYWLDGRNAKQIDQLINYLFAQLGVAHRVQYTESPILEMMHTQD